MLKRLTVITIAAVLFLGVQFEVANAALVNGGFETGDFTGWLLTNVDLDNDFVFVAETSTQHSGIYEALLGKTGSEGTISQIIDTTAGQAYRVSFWLANDMPGTNRFQALWNGAVMNPNLADSPAFDYAEYTYTAIAQGNSASIAFNFQNDPSTFHLDDVSAAPVPIPGAVWLLGSGLFALIGLSRTKKS